MTEGKRVSKKVATFCLAGTLMLCTAVSAVLSAETVFAEEGDEAIAQIITYAAVPDPEAGGGDGGADPNAGGGASSIDDCKNKGSGVDSAKCGVEMIDPEGGGGDLIQKVKGILSVVLMVVGIVAVGVIILGGVNYSISAGDPSKVKKAKDTILYGVVGLVICLLAYAIVNFVLQAI